MVRLTAQQRAELVQLHLQDESIDAIVQQTGHARTTVLRWVRRVAVAGLLLDRPRVRSAIERHDAHCGRSDQTIGEGQTSRVGVDQRVRLLLC